MREPGETINLKRSLSYCNCTVKNLQSSQKPLHFWAIYQLFWCKHWGEVWSSELDWPELICENSDRQLCLLPRTLGFLGFKVNQYQRRRYYSYFSIRSGIRSWPGTNGSVPLTFSYSDNNSLTFRLESVSLTDHWHPGHWIPPLLFEYLYY